jgi:hypothetical protein
MKKKKQNKTKTTTKTKRKYITAREKDLITWVWLLMVVGGVRRC